MNAKKMDAEEFRQTGLLFELNRLVLHPHGMALAVSIDDDETKPPYLVMLRTDDPDGIAFDPEYFKTGAARLEQFMEAEGRKNLAEREKILGFIVQEEHHDVDF